MSLKRFGVSLDEALLSSLDEFVEKSGFSNRSQALRFLIEKNITEEKWLCNHLVAGAVIIMYDRTRKDIASQIDAIEEEHSSMILSSSQYYIDNGLCLHIATIKGKAVELTKLSDSLISIKGIRHGKLLMSRAE